MWILDGMKQNKNNKDLAIIHKDKKISYSELWDNSEKIAEWLLENLESKAPILIYGNKNIEIIEVMLASLKTGRAYIPVDITFPIDRVKKICEISKSTLIFNFSDEDICMKDKNIKIVDKNSLQSILENDIKNSIKETNWVKDEDVCYILFTSGSTGAPKGVPITKKNIINFVDWFKEDSSITGNVVLNQVSYSFDVSVIQIYLYLPNGKTLFCIDKEMISDFGLMFEHLKKSNISSWVSTPSFIEMCIIYDIFDNKLLPKLEKVILAGEVLTKKLVTKIWEKFPGVKVINGYGPTEGTVLLTSCEITEEMMLDNDNELPIGYLLPDANYKIEKVELEDGMVSNSNKDNKGELIVSSNSISNGYYNNEEETSKKFSYDINNNCMQYRTGDIVYQKNNLLYYCGRKDFQIKLNGYRIELDDICENINKIAVVNNNVVMPVFKDGKVQYIVSFVVLNENQNEPQTNDLKTNIFIRKELSKLIPSYMIPKKIVIIDRFPLNVNGKIDRKLLMEKYL